MKKKYLGLLAGIVITMSLAACESTTDSTQVAEANTVDQTELTNSVEPTENETSDNTETKENESLQIKYNGNDDFIGIKLEGYKTELTIYQNYEGVLDYASYTEKAKDFVLDYIHNNVDPDFNDITLTYSSYESRGDDLQDYNYLASDWKGIVGKSYRYSYWHYGDKSDAVYYTVSYDPKNEIMFIENEGLDELHRLLNSDEITVYATPKKTFGYADEKAEVENYVDFAAEYADFTRYRYGGFFAYVHCNMYDKPEYADIIAIIEKYSNYTEKRFSELENYEYVEYYIDEITQ